MTTDNPDNPLDAIRREIDSVDDQILDLLMRRFAATDRVKATKARDGTIATSPFRPAREATMMRRLMAAAGTSLSPELLLRLWRVILSASKQSQAPVRLHMDSVLGNDLTARLLISQHFIGMTVELHSSPRHALEAVSNAKGDLTLIAPSSDWAAGFLSGAAGTAKVVATLPVIIGDIQPQILVVGHSAMQPSGDDETLLLISEDQAELSGALWQARSGTTSLAALPGFLDDSAVILHRGARLAGRYPRPIKVLP